VCNSNYAISCFGLRVFYLGKVAGDEVGNVLVEDLQSTEFYFHNAEASSGVTGKCLVMVAHKDNAQNLKEIVNQVPFDFVLN